MLAERKADSVMPKHSPPSKDVSPSPPSRTPAILFDLDGTLMDSNYEHVTAWRLAFQRAGIEIPNAFLHRCIGLRGDLLIRAVCKETRRTGRHDAQKLEELHRKYFGKNLRGVRPLPGASALLHALSRRKVRWAIATGGDKRTVEKMLRRLPMSRAIAVVTADDVDQAKPEPDVFVVAARRLGIALSECIVVGDSVWDLLAARRAKALGIGLLSGGYGDAELAMAGAFRVYKHPADLLEHLAEIGIDAR
jgi:HAD superfamily hydrolase (TIGR01509 family)